MICKRILTVFVCAAMILTLGSCQNLSRERKTPVSVTIWHYYIGEQKKVFDDMVDVFNTTVGVEKLINVSAESKSSISNLNEQVLASVNGDPGAEPVPDMFFAYADIAYAMYQKDMLADYRDYLSDSELELFVPEFLAEGRISGDDSVLMLPVAKSTEILVINKTDFDIFLDGIKSVPGYSGIGYGSFETWEGILKASEAYYNWTFSKDGEGKALFGIDAVANFIYSTHSQFGEDILLVNSGAGTVDLSTDAMRRVWETLYVPMLKGYFAAYGRFRSDDMKTGDILAFLGSSASGTYIPAEVTNGDGSVYPIEITIMPTPYYTDGIPSAIQQGAGVAVIKSDKAHEVAAAEFLMWFTEKERNTDFAVKASYLPVTTEAVKALAGSLDQAAGQGTQSDVLGVSINQMDAGYVMVVPPVFDNSYLVRDILESRLTEIIVENRAKAVAEISGGADYGEVMLKYSSDDYFIEFINACQRDINALGVSVIK